MRRIIVIAISVALTGCVPPKEIVTTVVGRYHFTNESWRCEYEQSH